MAGLAKVTKAIKKANKQKKHGKKAGQKSLIRPSQKKAVKNGRHQVKETPKKKLAKTLAAMPAGLDGHILPEEEFELPTPGCPGFPEDLDIDDMEEFLDEELEDEPDFDEGEVPCEESNASLDAVDDPHND